MKRSINGFALAFAASALGASICVAEEDFRSLIINNNDGVQISQDVYKDISTGIVDSTSGYKRTRNWEDIINQSDRTPKEKADLIAKGRESGFFAAEYKSGDKTVIAFRGTDTLIKDWRTNLAQASGLPISSNQYDLLAKEMSKDISKINGATCTGHSLGGGLSNYACGLAGRASLAINAAGLNIKHYSEVINNSKATNLFVGDDKIHKMGLTLQPGKSYWIDTSAAKGQIYDKVNFNIKDIGRAVTVGMTASPAQFSFVPKFGMEILRSGLKDTHTIDGPAGIFKTFKGIYDKEESRIPLSPADKANPNVLTARPLPTTVLTQPMPGSTPATTTLPRFGSQQSTLATAPLPRFGSQAASSASCTSTQLPSFSSTNSKPQAAAKAEVKLPSTLGPMGTAIQAKAGQRVGSSPVSARPVATTTFSQGARPQFALQKPQAPPRPTPVFQGHSLGGGVTTSSQQRQRVMQGHSMGGGLAPQRQVPQTRPVYQQPRPVYQQRIPSSQPSYSAQIARQQQINAMRAEAARQTPWQAQQRAYQQYQFQQRQRFIQPSYQTPSFGCNQLLRAARRC